MPAPWGPHESRWIAQALQFRFENSGRFGRKGFSFFYMSHKFLWDVFMLPPLAGWIRICGFKANLSTDGSVFLVNEADSRREMEG